MGLKRLYKAQKSKRNITKGAKDLNAIQKLSDKAIKDIDLLLEESENEKIKDDLLALKTMISSDLSTKDNMAISNYLYGRLYRTHVTTSYTLEKKKFQLDFLENSSSISKNSELAELYKTALEILDKSTNVATNLLNVTQTYAITNRDLLARNSEEFKNYLDEYNTYIADRTEDINEEISELENLKLDLSKIYTKLNQITLDDVESSIDDTTKLIYSLYMLEMNISKLILDIPNLNIENSELVSSLLTNLNKVIVMTNLNIFKIIKPFNTKYETFVSDFNINENISKDFKNLKNIYINILSTLN